MLQVDLFYMRVAGLHMILVMLIMLHYKSTVTYGVLMRIFKYTTQSSISYLFLSGSCICILCCVTKDDWSSIISISDWWVTQQDKMIPYAGPGSPFIISRVMLSYSRQSIVTGLIMKVHLTILICLLLVISLSVLM
jgi:hypothetical protein